MGPLGLRTTTPDLDPTNPMVLAKHAWAKNCGGDFGWGRHFQMNMDWIELDIHDPHALRQIKDAAPMPIASLETLYGRKQFKPYLDAGAVDIAIVDTLWNGVWESMKIASLCDTYAVNCAAHNFAGHLQKPRPSGQSEAASGPCF